MDFKIKMLPALFLTGLLVSCNTFPASAEKSEKKSEKKETAPVKQEKSLPDSSVKQEKALSADRITDGEKVYITALQTQDESKRSQLFKDARKLLMKEAEEEKNLKAYLLLAYMADLGQGMRSDSIMAARNYRIAADGGLPEAKLALAEFWLRNRIFLDEAAKQVESVPGYEKKPSALVTLGMIWYARGDHEKGFEYFRKAYQDKGASPQLRMQIIKLIHSTFERFFKAANHDAAMKELEREQVLDPKNALIPYFMGLVEQKRGRLEKAEEYFNQSLKKNPAVPFAYRELAFLKARGGRDAEAMDDIKVMYAITGKSPRVLKDLLEICFLTKQYDELLRLLNLELRRDPSRLDMRHIRSSLLLIRKKYKEAMEDLRILLKHPELSGSLELQEAMALAASYLNQHEEAAKAYEAILSKGFQPVASLNLAELYIVMNRYEDALKLLQRKEFYGSTDPFQRCISTYLEATALLALDRNADAQLKVFETLLPKFKAMQNQAGIWEVELFRSWLKKAQLSDKARKSITEMTDKVTFTLPVEKTQKK